MSTGNLILFGEDRPDVYLLNQVYDPDVDGSDVSASGKIVPARGSIVLDNSAGGTNYVAYTVHAVNPVTFKCTLVPIRVIYDDKDVGRVVSYGNDMHVLYYDDRISPKRLVIDSKLVILGSNSSEYKLIRNLGDGTKASIGLSMDADGSTRAEFVVDNVGTNSNIIPRHSFEIAKQFSISTFVAAVWVGDIQINESNYTAALKTGDPSKVVVTIDNSIIYAVGAAVTIRLYSVSDRAAILATGLEAVKRCAPAYTTEPMVDGDIVTLEIYDSAGVLISSISLTTKRSTILNDLESSTNPIVSFQARANQEKTSGEFILYTDQTIDQLTIAPELVFANGNKKVLTVDGLSTFVYGLDDIQTLIPGMEYPILIKTFLARGVTSLVGELHPDGTRFINVMKTIVVTSRVTQSISKVSIVPKWNSAQSKWDFHYFAYYVNRDSYKIVTGQVTYQGTAPNGALFGTRQSFVLVLPYSPNNDGVIVNHVQDMAILLRAPDTEVPYEISERSTSGTIYGIQNEDHQRPVLQYDSNLQKYFIPTSKWTSEYWFLEQFYTHGEPPYLHSSETESPFPTDFVVRNSTTGEVLTTVPIETGDYDKSFVLKKSNSALGFDQHVGTTVIVEFLINTPTMYRILYGVPVQVGTGTFNQ